MEDSKLPASPTSPSSKRRKDNSGNAAKEEVFDLISILKFQKGNKLEVKWTINDDEAEGDTTADNSGEAAATMPAAEATLLPARPKGITVWWAATLSDKTGQYHVLTDQDEEGGEGSPNISSPPKRIMKLPIYTLSYEPMEELGFDGHSLEDVAFISDKVLLNLSTDEMMTFRKDGEPSPPSSPIPNPKEVEAAHKNDSAISRVANGKEEMSNLLDDIMLSAFSKTGIDQKMKSLPAYNQMIIAERMAKAKEGLLAKILEETDKMGSREKVITADVVNKCMSDLDGSFNT